MKKTPIGRAAGCIFLLTVALRAQALPASDVRLLRYPYPYQAAVTVCNDQHVSKDPVARFEAVHTLVNTRDWIPRGSAKWKVLFQDSAIDQNPAWKDGIQGFGLPIGDSVWLYNGEVGVFNSFDDETGRPVAHIYADGRNYADIIDGWIRRGWVDMLHGAGPGDISRQAVGAALVWLKAEPHRHMEAWSDHSINYTPSDIEPDLQTAITRIGKNIAKMIVGIVRTEDDGKVIDRYVRDLRPAPFPPGQQWFLRSLSTILVASLAWLVASLAVSRLRTRRNVLVGAMLLSIVCLVMYETPLHYAQGDNPGTRYYNVDLVRAAGFRFFNPIEFPGSVQENILALPETSFNGRSTYLRPMKIDDGTTVWMFSRAYSAADGLATLEMLTKKALDELVQKQGATILYTHWISNAPKVFSAVGLGNLAQLSMENDGGRIWVDSTTALLKFELVRTFLDYKVSDDGIRLVIDLANVEDPVGGAFVPTVADLRGISFAVPSDREVEVRLHGAVLPADVVEHIKDPNSGIVRIGWSTPHS